MKRAFISYSAKDKKHMDFVRDFAVGMDSALQVFVDRYSIKGGDDWEAEIRRSLAICDIFILVWSKNAKYSKWVCKESAFAIQLYKASGSPRIIPISIDNENLTSELETFQAVKLYTSLGDQLRIRVSIVCLVGTVCLYTAFVFRQKEVLIFMWLVWLWLMIILFTGIRYLSAPWEEDTSNRKGRFLLHTIEVGRSEAVLVFLFSILNMVFGLALILIY